MYKWIIATIFGCLLYSNAQAQDAGTGLMCDTAEQAKQVALSEGLKHVEGCGMLTFLYERVAEVERIQKKDHAEAIVQIVVIAVFNGQWFRISPRIQYTILLTEERSA